MRPQVFLPGFGVGTFHFEAVMEAMRKEGVSRRVYALGECPFACALALNLARHGSAQKCSG
jgi:hypothetical protein